MLTNSQNYLDLYQKALNAAGPRHWFIALTNTLDIYIEERESWLKHRKENLLPWNRSRWLFNKNSTQCNLECAYALRNAEKPSEMLEIMEQYLINHELEHHWNPQLFSLLSAVYTAVVESTYSPHKMCFLLDKELQALLHSRELTIEAFDKEDIEDLDESSQKIMTDLVNKLYRFKLGKKELHVFNPVSKSELNLLLQDYEAMIRCGQLNWPNEKILVPVLINPKTWIILHIKSNFYQAYFMGEVTPEEKSLLGQIIQTELGIRAFYHEEEDKLVATEFGSSSVALVAAFRDIVMNKVNTVNYPDVKALAMQYADALYERYLSDEYDDFHLPGAIPRTLYAKPHR